MPPFPEPRFRYRYVVADEVKALRRYRDTKAGRAIPAKVKTRLLLATWNIANLGVQDRLETDYELIAEMISWFDLIAIQEVNDDLRGIFAIRDKLPSTYELLFSDASGNDERQAFIFDRTRASVLEEVGRLAIPPRDTGKIKLASSTISFPGFDRGPYLASFRSGKLDFMLVNVHLYFGSNKPKELERRVLETYAVAWWANKRANDKNAYVANIIPLGDFNLPKAIKGDPIWDALTYRGLETPEHTSRIGSAIASENQYDQIAFFPAMTGERFTGAMNVFDFDGALFADLYRARKRTQFLAYMRFHISDHRPLWAQFRTT